MRSNSLHPRNDETTLLGPVLRCSPFACACLVTQPFIPPQVVPPPTITPVVPQQPQVPGFNPGVPGFNPGVVVPPPQPVSQQLRLLCGNHD